MCCVAFAPKEIIAYGAAEKQCLLRHNGYRRAQRMLVHAVHIAVVYIYRALRSIVKAGNKVYKRCFARARGADYAERFPFAHGQAYAA